MLDFVGIKEEQLPQLVEPGEDLGQLTDENIDEFNFSKNVVKIRRTFKPGKIKTYRKQYEVFLNIYDRLFD